MVLNRILIAVKTAFHQFSTLILCKRIPILQLLGIGRGFNLLCIYGSGLSSLRLPRFSAPYTLTTPLTFTQAGLSSYLFGNLTFGVVHSFATERIAPHWTREGVTREHFEGLSQRFTHVNQLVLCKSLCLLCKLLPLFLIIIL